MNLYSVSLCNKESLHVKKKKKQHHTSERAKQSKMSKNNSLGDSVLLLLSSLSDPFSRQGASRMKYYDTSFRWDSIMSYKIVYLCYVAQGDKERKEVAHVKWCFFLLEAVFFAQKIFASIFFPLVGLYVFSVINCNLKCVKYIYKK